MLGFCIMVLYTLVIWFIPGNISLNLDLEADGDGGDQMGGLARKIKHQIRPIADAVDQGDFVSPKPNAANEEDLKY